MKEKVNNMYSLGQHLLSACYLPGTLLETGITAADKVSAGPHGTYVLLRKTNPVYIINSVVAMTCKYRMF